MYDCRTEDKLEVDAVIETPDGRVVGVEVKAGATVRTQALAGLRNVANHLADKFVAGMPRSPLRHKVRPRWDEASRTYR